MAVDLADQRALAGRRAAARAAGAEVEAGDLRGDLGLVDGVLRTVDLRIVIGVQPLEEAQGVVPEFVQGQGAVVVGVGAGEPGGKAVFTAERLARGADEQGLVSPARRRALARRGLGVRGGGGEHGGGDDDAKHDLEPLRAGPARGASFTGGAAKAGR